MVANFLLSTPSLNFFLFFSTGIKSVLVGLLAQKAEVKFDKNKITIDEIICHVKELGFGCDLMDKGGQGEGSVDIIVSKHFSWELFLQFSIFLIF